MSRKTSRRLINRHHALEKERQNAIRHGDQDAQQQLAAQIAALGGLDRYQLASLQGQRPDRGGDTSKTLLEWLGPGASVATPGPGKTKIRMLEVGALSTQNACSASPLFAVDLIDLNSRGPGILQQDFMQRPLPSRESDRFDVVSLSLVLNFVPEPGARGEMLRRSLCFLRQGQYPEGAPYPCLYVVLPRSCVSNSRYFSDDRFRDLMALLGYRQLRTKLTSKLVYYLWRLEHSTQARDLSREPFPKQAVALGGRSRNNFSIILS